MGKRANTYVGMAIIASEQSHYQRIRTALMPSLRVVLFFLLLLATFALFASETAVYTYFPGTDHELKVYQITGTEPGPTLMIIAAIQGDETAPIRAIDSLIDINLKKGNLIIVPRANLPTIFAGKRQINYDMNRRFDQTPVGDDGNLLASAFYEDLVVFQLKTYIRQADMLLNLHEGGGFYRHSFEGINHNSSKYGQCFIADADTFYVASTRKTINLKKIAETIIEKINKQITVPEYTYRFNNHNTLAINTKHPEQRKSATYFALTSVNIPAFGIEVSKSLPTATLKAQYIQSIVHEFMSYLDITEDKTPAQAEPPALRYLLVKRDDQQIFVQPNDVLSVPQNSTLQIIDVITNYTRGAFVDVAGYGNKNDINKTFNIEKNTQILVYKDDKEIARIPIRITSSTMVAFEGIRANVTDDRSSQIIFHADTLTVTDGAELELVLPNRNISVNIAGATIKNISGKLMLDTATSLDPRFAINTDQNLYDIVIAESGKTIANAYLKIKPISPATLYLSLNGKDVSLAPSDTLYFRHGDTLFIKNVDLNGLSSSKVKVNLAGYVLDPRKDGEDRGGNIYLTAQNLISSYATSRDKKTYEIHVLYKQKKYATYFLRLRG